MEDKSVIKHSAAVHISNEVNLIQRKIWNILLANAYNHLPDREIHEVSFNELLDVLGFNSNNTEYVKKAVEELVKLTIHWNILGKDKKNKWGWIHFLAEAKYEDGVLSYAYPPTLRKLLHNPDWYVQIKLSMQNKFVTKHGLALFEICADAYIKKRGQGTTGWLSLDIFKELMGLNSGGEEEQKYRDFKTLNRDVIKPALKEVNAAGDFTVTVEFRRTNRRISALRFDILENLKEVGEQPSLAAIFNQELFNRLQEFFCLSKEDAQRVVSSHDEGYIMENLVVVEERYRAGKVKENLAAYTMKAMEVDFRPKKSAFERKQENEQEDENVLRTLLFDLETDYTKSIKTEAARLLSEMTEEQRKEQISAFEEDRINPFPAIIGIYQKRKLQSPLFRTQFENYLVKKKGPADLVDLISFAKTQGLRVEKDADEKYKIVGRCDNAS